jgi:ribosomal protein S18 acetylase RimI-like enzyme
MDIDREYTQNDGVFLIMENDHKELIATGALKKIDDRVYKIRKMYVSKPHRKKGYGKEILSNLLEIAQRKGAKTVVLETSASMTAAISLYKKFGFIESEKKPISPRCNITMIKKIDHIKT